MGKAIDPFEEYLRKKKVEKLERKYRDAPEEGKPPAAARPPGVPPDEDPQIAAKLREEMEDFLQSGKSAAVQAFQNAQHISDDKVDEIKDALEGVFEDDAPAPQTVDRNDDAGDTFVSFFKQVQEEYDEREVCDDVSCLPPDDSPLGSTHEADLLRGASVEIAYDEDEGADAPPDASDRRLDLEAILVEGARKQDLAKRFDVLCRLVVKLCERTGLPESDIIEACIKGGLEF
jgi:hypothetical protein